MDSAALRQVLTLANDFKEGDLAVGGTADGRVRAEARRALLGTTMGSIRRTPLVHDGVSDALARARERSLDGTLDPLTVADVRSLLLGRGGADWARIHGTALSSEAIAALVKVMSGNELSAAARALANPLDGEGVAIGSLGHFRSRIQPNSPGDAE